MYTPYLLIILYISFRMTINMKQIKMYISATFRECLSTISLAPFTFPSHPQFFVILIFCQIFWTCFTYITVLILTISLHISTFVFFLLVYFPINQNNNFPQYFAHSHRQIMQIPCVVILCFCLH